MIRIVKMSFAPEHIEAFKALIDERKEKIRNVEGCTKLEVYQDKAAPNVFFTYSYWNSEFYLNQYRNSELFQETWALTKQLFNGKPEAWSVDVVHQL